MSPARLTAWAHAPMTDTAVTITARAAVTITACGLAAGVAVVAPVWARPALDAVATVALAVPVVIVGGAVGAIALDALVAAEPRVWRAVGRLAFRVARACYAAARRG